MGPQESSASFPTFYLLLFRSHPPWLVGVNLSDRTASGCDFHPACTAWGADAEIWNHDAGSFLKGWKCRMQKGDLADALMMVGIWDGKISMS